MGPDPPTTNGSRQQGGEGRRGPRSRRTVNPRHTGRPGSQNADGSPGRQGVSRAERVWDRKATGERGSGAAQASKYQKVAGLSPTTGRGSRLTGGGGAAFRNTRPTGQAGGSATATGAVHGGLVTRLIWQWRGHWGNLDRLHVHRYRRSGPVSLSASNRSRPHFDHYRQRCRASAGGYFLTSKLTSPPRHSSASTVQYIAIPATGGFCRS